VVDLVAAGDGLTNMAAVQLVVVALVDKETLVAAIHQLALHHT
jgi:hypothetical protein